MWYIYFEDVVHELNIFTAVYTGTGKNCENIDECSAMNGESTARHNCDSNAMCTDSEGSFDCDCLPGYIGDGVNCTGIDIIDINTYLDLLCKVESKLNLDFKWRFCHMLYIWIYLHKTLQILMNAVPVDVTGMQNVLMFLEVSAVNA